MGPWICDVCGESIATVEAGWVEWISRRDRNLAAVGLRLVHHKPASPRSEGCYHSREAAVAQYGTNADLPLSSFVGPNGLMRLLEFIHRNDFEQEEVLELIKRLHIPGYEEARGHIAEAIADGVYEPNGPENYPHFEVIERINRSYQM